MPDEHGRNAIEATLRVSVDTTDVRKVHAILDDLVSYAESKGLTIEGYGLDRYPGVRSQGITRHPLP